MKKIFVTLDEFKEKVINSDDYCFICLEPKSSKRFTDEHILPKWILKKFNLFNQKITLPNKSQFTYRSYLIPCCEECNSALNKTYETPISNLFNKSFAEILQKIRKDRRVADRIFHWLALIFIKTKLKTTALYEHQNLKLGTEKIGDRIEWGYLHHIYLMSRVHFTNALINTKVYGSIIILKAQNTNNVDNFDYSVSAQSRCILLKINDLCIISCFDDGCIIPAKVNSKIRSK